MFWDSRAPVRRPGAKTHASLSGNDGFISVS